MVDAIQDSDGQDRVPRRGRSRRVRSKSSNRLKFVVGMTFRKYFRYLEKSKCTYDQRIQAAMKYQNKEGKMRQDLLKCILADKGDQLAIVDEESVQSNNSQSQHRKMAKFFGLLNSHRNCEKDESLMLLTEQLFIRLRRRTQSVDVYMLKRVDPIDVYDIEEFLPELERTDQKNNLFIEEEIKEEGKQDDIQMQEYEQITVKITKKIAKVDYECSNKGEDKNSGSDLLESPLKAAHHLPSEVNIDLTSNVKMVVSNEQLDENGSKRKREVLDFPSGSRQVTEMISVLHRRNSLVNSMDNSVISSFQHAQRVIQTKDTKSNQQLFSSVKKGQRIFIDLQQ